MGSMNKIKMPLLAYGMELLTVSTKLTPLVTFQFALERGKELPA